MKTKILAATLCLAIIMSIAAYAAPSPGDSARASVVIEAESGNIIFEKNAHERKGPASTTKIMTALVALEKGDPEDIVKIDARAVGTEGSSAYLCAGRALCFPTCYMR